MNTIKLKDLFVAITLIAAEATTSIAYGDSPLDECYALTGFEVNSCLAKKSAEIQKGFDKKRQEFIKDQRDQYGNAAHEKAFIKAEREANKVWRESIPKECELQALLGGELNSPAYGAEHSACIYNSYYNRIRMFEPQL